MNRGDLIRHHHSHASWVGLVVKVMPSTIIIYRPELQQKIQAWPLHMLNKIEVISESR